MRIGNHSLSSSARARVIIIAWLGLGAWLGLASSALAQAPAASSTGGLDEYVVKPDSSYAWKKVVDRKTPIGTAHDLELTSQTWRGIVWKHGLRIHEPAELKHKDVCLLFISGGRIGEGPRDRESPMCFDLANRCGARVALLNQVPNQPLLGGRNEDDLISETFVEYLKSGEKDWPLLLPMVKSAVRAMDAVQSWSKEEGTAPIERFVVTGASKRGWTTWLTSAVASKRVIALAPMVIDTLNMPVQMKRQKAIWGKPSEQIEDYNRRGLLEAMETEKGKILWRMVDPLSYLPRIPQPKMLIHGTNDPYWTQDAMNVYWKDVPGEKHCVYLPNAGHGLDQNREYAVQAISALLLTAANGKTLPKVSWRHDNAEDGKLRLTVKSAPKPVSATMWIAETSSRDFRKSKWESRSMKIGQDAVTGEIARPADANLALFADLRYRLDGVEFHLSTQIREANSTEPLPEGDTGP